MKVQMERIMDRYGQTVTLCRKDRVEPQETRAFLQPVLKEQTEPPVAVTPLGPVSEQRWLYIGRAGVEIAPEDQMSYGKAQLIVQEVRPVYWQDEVLYRRAILRRKKEAAV